VPDHFDQQDLKQTLDDESGAQASLPSRREVDGIRDVIGAGLLDLGNVGIGLDVLAPVTLV
jgi:hypothetical protein